MPTQHSLSEDDLRMLKELAEANGWSYEDDVRQNVLDSKPKHNMSQRGTIRSTIMSVFREYLSDAQLEILHSVLTGTASDLSELHPPADRSDVTQTAIDEYEWIAIAIRQVQAERKKASESPALP